MKKIIVAILFFITNINFANADSIGYFRDSADGIKFAFWYPSTSAVDTEKLGPFKVSYALRGEIKQGKYPLVIISHGNGGRLLSHRRTAEHLVKKGFVVFTVQHTVDKQFNFSRPDLLQKRADELAIINKALTQNIDIKNNVDITKKYIIGFSLGGATTLLSAGVGYDFNKMLNHCADNFNKDKEFCKIQTTKKQVGENIVRITKPQKYTKIILIAPLGKGAVKGDLQNINTDVLLVRLGGDSVLSYPFHSQYLAENINSGKLKYLTKSKAHHYAFISPFPKFIKIPEAKDPQGFNREQFLQQLSQDIVKFLR